MSTLLFYFEYITKWGFTITFPMLLLGYLIKKQWRPFIKEWLSGSYIIAFVYCMIELANKLSVHIERLKLIPENNEGYDFYYSSTYDASVYFYFALLTLVLIVFIFRRIRASLWWGISVLFAFHFETIYVALAWLYRDYLPSSWSVYYHTPVYVNPYLFSFIAFNLLVTGIYFLKKIWVKKTVKAAN